MQGSASERFPRRSLPQAGAGHALLERVGAHFRSRARRHLPMAFIPQPLGAHTSREPQEHPRWLARLLVAGSWHRA